MQSSNQENKVNPLPKSQTEAAAKAKSEALNQVGNNVTQSPSPEVKAPAVEDKSKFKVTRLWQRFQSLPGNVKAMITVTLLPTLLALLYFILIASNMYVSDTKFAVRSSSDTGSSFDMASQIFNIPSSSTKEALIVEDYLRSVDVFFALDRELNIKAHFSSSDYDVFSRLSKNATLDEIEKFWHKITRIEVNQDSGVISFEVRAYTPQMAEAIAQNALRQSEKLINSMNERARNDALDLARNEVNLAQHKLTESQEALKEFRNLHRDLDLKSTAEGLQNLILDLEGQATSIRAQLSENLIYMQKDAPAVKTLKARLEGIEQQIERERAKLTEVSGSGNSINTLAGQYERLVLESQFANKQFEYALTSMETAKLQVMAKSLYVVTVAKPTSPDESLYPEPLLFSLYIFFALAMISMICSVIVAAVKEHMGF